MKGQSRVVMGVVIHTHTRFSLILRMVSEAQHKYHTCASCRRALVPYFDNSKRNLSALARLSSSSACSSRRALSSGVGVNLSICSTMSAGKLSRESMLKIALQKDHVIEGQAQPRPTSWTGTWIRKNGLQKVLLVRLAQGPASCQP